MPSLPSDPAPDADRTAFDGGVAAFERVFRRYHAPLCDVVAGYVRSQDVAEEIVQDLFLAVWREPGQFAVRGSLRAYLFAMSAWPSLRPPPTTCFLRQNRPTPCTAQSPACPTERVQP